MTRWALPPVSERRQWLARADDWLQRALAPHCSTAELVDVALLGGALYMLAVAIFGLEVAPR